MYGALTSPGEGPEELFEELSQVSTSKMLLRTQMMLFFPHILIHSDGLREAVAGQGGLLDRRMVIGARQQDLPVDLLMAGANERTDSFREAWRSLPETVRRRGSIADSVAHAMIRLNAIHDQYFAVPPQAPPRSVPPLPGPEGEGDEVGETEGGL